MNKLSDEKASWDYAEIWDKFPVPARPSAEELDYLENELGKNPHDKVLILGSTIEYRSLCKKLGIKPYVADFEKSHYEILTKYSDEKFDGEHFLETDWLKLNQKNEYDVIVGHRPYNVIGKDVLPDFFQQIHDALKPGGLFFCKGNVKFEGDKDKLDDLIDKWAFQKNREYPLFSYIEVELYFYCTDDGGYVDYEKARKVVGRWFESKRITEEDFDLIKLLVSMSSEARFRGLIKENELKLVIKEAGFESQEWIILDKEICQNMPLIKLKK